MSALIRAAAILLSVFAGHHAVDPTDQAKKFIDLLSKGDNVAANSMLDASLKEKLPPETLDKIWQGVLKQVGSYKGIQGVLVSPSDSIDTVLVTCEFEKYTLDVKIPVKKDGTIAGLNFAQHVDTVPPGYVKKDSFKESEVAIGFGPWAVHGTLAMPNGPGPFPGVVLVSGSGANDRDSTLGPNKIFRDLAQGLATQGIASIRFNKRANEHPAEFAKLTSYTVKEECTDDALMAEAILRANSKVSGGKVFLLGHSLGATLAPRIASHDSGNAGLILLAGTTSSLLDLIVPQFKHNFSLHGPMSETQKKMLDTLQRQVEKAKDPALKADAPKEDMPFGVAAPYWLDLRDYHPEQIAESLNQPILVLQGERDYQVTMDDFGVWKKALAGKENAEFHSYPKLNHMFLEGEGVSSDEEYLKPGHFSQAVIDDIVKWIRAH